MAAYTQEITLDVNGTCLPIYKYIKQGDGDSTYVKVTLVANGVQLIPAGTDEAIIRVSKPDGTMAGDSATINGDGTITALITKQMTAAAGIAKADICLIGANEEVISSAPFYLDIDKMPGGEEIPSTNEFLYLLEKFASIDDSVEQAEQAKEEALAAVGDIDFRENNGYIQYTNNGGTTWKNLMQTTAIGAPITQEQIDALWP